MGAGTRVVLEPDGKVLDLEGLGLVDLDNVSVMIIIPVRFGPDPLLHHDQTPRVDGLAFRPTSPWNTSTSPQSLQSHPKCPSICRMLEQIDDTTYHVDGDDLTVGPLGLLELTKVVPESGLGDDLVGRKDPHSAVG